MSFAADIHITRYLTLMYIAPKSNKNSSVEKKSYSKQKMKRIGKTTSNLFD